MTTGYAGQAINSVLNSETGFCKFLSANDTGATGGHQSGILISKSAVRMLFTIQELEQAGIPKRTVKINGRMILKRRAVLHITKVKMSLESQDSEEDSLS